MSRISNTDKYPTIPDIKDEDIVLGSKGNDKKTKNFKFSDIGEFVKNFFNNITMDSNITMYDLPTYIQKEYGVYNGFIGTYLSKDYNTGDENIQKNSLYIYPLYNPVWVRSRKRKMRLYARIGFTSRMVDRTFLDSENNLDILVSAEESNNQIFGQYSASNGTGV